jgi:hypothetical protein
MRPLHALAVAAIVYAVWPAAAGAQPPTSTSAPARVDVHQLGPKVGERVPDFQLRDQNGAAQTPASIIGPSGGLLVFFRSADW